jgi:hypothetical protein
LGRWLTRPPCHRAVRNIVARFGGEGKTGRPVVGAVGETPTGERARRPVLHRRWRPVVDPDAARAGRYLGPGRGRCPNAVRGHAGEWPLSQPRRRPDLAAGFGRAGRGGRRVPVHHGSSGRSPGGRRPVCRRELPGGRHATAFGGRGYLCDARRRPVVAAAGRPFVPAGPTGLGPVGTIRPAAQRLVGGRRWPAELCARRVRSVGHLQQSTGDVRRFACETIAESSPHLARTGPAPGPGARRHHPAR